MKRSSVDNVNQDVHWVRTVSVQVSVRLCLVTHTILIMMKAHNHIATYLHL